MRKKKKNSNSLRVLYYDAEVERERSRIVNHRQHTDQLKYNDDNNNNYKIHRLYAYKQPSPVCTNTSINYITTHGRVYNIDVYLSRIYIYIYIIITAEGRTLCEQICSGVTKKDDTVQGRHNCAPAPAVATA